MTLQLSARTLLLGMLAVFALSGCGGGGGGSAGPAAQAGNPAPTTSQTPDDQTGVVGILIKDAPTQAFTRIIMHVTGVELLPADDGGGHATVFQGDKELDLLALQNFYDTLAVSENVPVGDYEKIRLFVDSITLYYLNDADEEVSSEAVVPANGKVDLNPRGSFTVSPNTAILIEIDVDAKNSFHVIQTGNGNGNAKQKWRFRPVVFVDIQQLKALEGLMRLSGTVGDIDTENNQFDLCEVDTQLHTDTNGCIPINVGDDTSLFGENGEPIAFGDLATGEPVTVYGFAVVVQSAHDDDSDDDGDDDSGMSSDDSDSDSDEDMDDDTVRMVQLDALVVQRAAADAIRSLSGTALSAPDESGMFTLDLADDEHDVDVPEVDVLVQDGTKILSAVDFSPLDASAIQTGTVAEVSGVVPDRSAPVLHAALILIAPPEESPDQLTGEITAIDTDSFTLFVPDADPPGDRCVTPTVDAHFVAVTELTDGGLLVEDASASDLETGQQVTVIGSDAESCFAAEDVVIQLVEEAPPAT